MESEKQKWILNHIKDGGEYTLKELFNNIPWRHYYYRINHLGLIMSRLVATGKIHRVKKGVFKINPNPPIKTKMNFTDKNQTSIF